MTTRNVKPLSIYGAVANWCSSQAPPATERDVQQKGAQGVAPESVSRITQHKTLDPIALGSLAQKRDT